jgi:hypothetical protein
MSSTPKKSAASRSETGGDGSGSALPNQGATAVADPPNGEPETLTPELFTPEDDDDTLEMPEVQQHAIDAAASKGASQQSPAGASGGKAGGSGPLDRDGLAFDPKIHESLPDGSPRLGPSGKLRRKRGGGGIPRTGGPSKSRIDPHAGQPTPEAQDLALKIQQTAAVATAMTFTLGQLIGGKDFAPIKDNKDHPGVDEPQEMHGAYVDTFTYYGISDLPPWAALAMVGVAYIGRRWHAEQFVARRKSWRERLILWWVNRKANKEKKRQESERQYRAEHGTNRPSELANTRGPQVPPP